MEKKVWESIIPPLKKRDYPLCWERPLVSGQLYTLIRQSPLSSDPADDGPLDMVRMFFSTAVGVEIFRIRGRFTYSRIDEHGLQQYYGYELEFVGVETLVPVNDDGLHRLKLVDSNGNEVKPTTCNSMEAR